MSRLPVLGLGTLWHFYRARLRTQAAQELLALAGIAAGVALIFAVEVANTSVTGSVEKLVRGVTGDADAAGRRARRHELRRRTVEQAVEPIPGVRVAAPALERARRRSPGPAGVARDRPDRRHARARRAWRAADGGARAPTACGSPMRSCCPSRWPRRSASRPASARAWRSTAARGCVPVSLTVSPATVRRPRPESGGDRPAGVRPAPHRPAGTDLARARLDRVPATSSRSAARCRRPLGARLNVAPATAESALIQQAAAPNEQSTALFAGVSALVGGLFAFTAMLLTVPDRRRFIAELRLQGFSTSQVSMQVAFESLLLGSVASALGLLLGDQLSRHVFEPLPGSLSFAFAIGDQRVVTPGHGRALVRRRAAGDARRRRAAAARRLLAPAARCDARAWRAPGAHRRRFRRGGLLLAGIALVAVTTLVALLAPDLTVVAPASLALALVLVLPSAFSLLLSSASASPGARRSRCCRSRQPTCARRRTRSVALAATVGARALRHGRDRGRPPRPAARPRRRRSRPDRHRRPLDHRSSAREHARDDAVRGRTGGSIDWPATRGWRACVPTAAPSSTTTAGVYG